MNIFRVFEIKIQILNFRENLFSSKKEFNDKPTEGDIVNFLKEFYINHNDYLHYETKIFITEFYRVKNKIIE